MHIRKTLEPGSLSSDNLRSMYEDSNGYIWIGTGGGGLNMLPKKDIDQNFNKFKHFTEIDKPYVINEVEYNNSKKLLVGGENTPGLYEIDITNLKK